MIIHKITEHPPSPTEAERDIFFFGHANTQHARMNKKTGDVEYWWTGGDGKWGLGGRGMPRFVCTPTLKSND